MKKFCFVFLAVFLAGVAFAASINTRWGYRKAQWGSTLVEVRRSGFNTKEASPEMQQFIDIFFNKNKDVKGYEVSLGGEESLFAFYKDKLFFASDAIAFNQKPKKVTQKLIDSFVDQMKNKYSPALKFVDGKDNVMNDMIINKDGTVEGCSVEVTFDWGKNIAVVKMFDWDVYKELEASGKYASKKGIVDQLAVMANKLSQEGKNGKKASFAFIALTGDNRNTKIENYVTDALTEAVFNTSKIRIIERANLEEILSEQKFQTSGLVDEAQAKAIGNIAGVDYVCYGTLKDSGDALTVSARVVDVETGEIAAMTRASVKKDEYILAHIGDKTSAPAIAVAADKASSSASSTDKAAAPKADSAKASESKKSAIKSLWKMRQNRNDFDEYTTYTFTLEGATKDKCIVFGYDKNDNAVKSIVRAGFSWSGTNWGSRGGNYGSYDIKDTNGVVVTKNFNYTRWSFDTGWKEGKENIYFTYNKGESARFVLDIIGNNDFITLRHDNETQRFQTAGFWDALEAAGITKAEIDAAISNEEF